MTGISYWSYALVFGTLLGDADGIYNPRDHNDRLLLGLKGTMSEAELHILRSRLDAGKKNKAKRGEYVGEALSVTFGLVTALNWSRTHRLRASYVRSSRSSRSLEVLTLC